jgi:hypothetical protein
MWLFKKLQKLNRKFALTIMLALIAFAFFVYDRFIADKHPQVYFDVLTSTAVLDIKEDLPKLEILFDGINIREQNLSLRIVSLKVFNDSSKDIRKVDYDTEDPIGFRVQPGKIIRRPELVDASNDYLAKNLSFSSPANNIVHFKDVIFDAHQYFVIKLLVLHPANQTPTISPIGHIAGMKSILVRESYKDFGRVSFWKRAFAGSWGIQLLRMIVYPVIAILAILLIVLPPSLISDMLHKWKRKRVVKEFKGVTSVQLNENDEYLFTAYVNHGEHTMLAMQRLVQNQKTLKKGLSECLDSQSVQKVEIAHARAEIDEKDIFRESFSYRVNLGKELVDNGFVKISGKSATVDSHMKNTLNRFVLFLKNKGMISRSDQTRITIAGVGTFTVADLTEQTKSAKPVDK